MVDSKSAAGQRKPTGQEMDQEYDELHEAGDEAVADDEHLPPGSARLAGARDREEYMEGADLKDPD